MGGQLAFDRDAINVLRMHLRGAFNEIDRAIGGDSAAATARTRAKRAIWALDAWPARLADISGCGVMYGYRPSEPGSGLIADAYFNLLAGGRTMVVDPLATIAAMQDVDAITRARLVGETLRAADLDELALAETKLWLREQLTVIESSPAAGTAFMRAVGVERFLELNNLYVSPARTHPLVVTHDLMPDGTPELLATIDALGRVFGTYRAANPGREQANWNEPLLTSMEPLALARLVRAGVGIDGAWSDRDVQLAATTALEGIGPGFVREPINAVAGAEALWLLAARPTAAQAFLEEAERSIVESALLHFDSAARNAMLFSSVDDRVFQAGDIQLSMQRVIDILTSTDLPIGRYDALDPFRPSLPTGIAAYFAPFLPELFGANDLRTLTGESASAWSSSTGLGADAAQLFVLMGHHADSFPILSEAANLYFGLAITSGDVGLIEDSGRIISSLLEVQNHLNLTKTEEYHSFVDWSRSVAAGAGVSLLEEVPFLGKLVGAADAVGIVDWALGIDSLDLHDEFARMEFDQVALSFTLGWSAVAAWASYKHLPMPIIPPPPTNDAEAGEGGTDVIDQRDDGIIAWAKSRGAGPHDIEEIEAILRSVDAATGGNSGGSYLFG